MTGERKHLSSQSDRFLHPCIERTMSLYGEMDGILSGEMEMKVNMDGILSGEMEMKVNI